MGCAGLLLLLLAPASGAKARITPTPTTTKPCSDRNLLFLLVYSRAASTKGDSTAANTNTLETAAVHSIAGYPRVLEASLLSSPSPYPDIVDIADIVDILGQFYILNMFNLLDIFDIFCILIYFLFFLCPTKDIWKALYLCCCLLFLVVCRVCRDSQD